MLQYKCHYMGPRRDTHSAKSLYLRGLCGLGDHSLLNVSALGGQQNLLNKEPISISSLHPLKRKNIFLTHLMRGLLLQCVYFLFYLIMPRSFNIQHCQDFRLSVLLIQHHFQKDFLKHWIALSSLITTSLLHQWKYDSFEMLKTKST